MPRQGDDDGAAPLGSSSVTSGGRRDVSALALRRETVAVLHEAIERTGLATLVSMGAGGIEASHIPMLLDRAEGPLGTLRGHIARANPQCTRVAPDVERLLALVTRLTEAHESWRSQPWAVGDAPADYIRANLEAIIGIEFQIEELDGKWKVSQYRTAQDRLGVAEGLEQSGDAGEIAVAALVRAARGD